MQHLVIERCSHAILRKKFPLSTRFPLEVAQLTSNALVPTLEQYLQRLSKQLQCDVTFDQNFLLEVPGTCRFFMKKCSTNFLLDIYM